MKKLEEVIVEEEVTVTRVLLLIVFIGFVAYISIEKKTRDITSLIN